MTWSVRQQLGLSLRSRKLMITIYTLPENDNKIITPDDDEDKDIAPENMIDISGYFGGMGEGVGP